MTPTELRAALALHGMTQSGFARTVGYAPRTVREWCAGNREIPELLARVIRLSEHDKDLLPRIASAASVVAQ